MASSDDVAGSASGGKRGSVSRAASTADQFCHELSQAFHVQPTEVALLRLEDGCLRFLFPKELQTAGSIPISSSSAIVAHTATSKKIEIYNSFATVKHASIFETVPLLQAEDHAALTRPPIQRLMSAPILDKSGGVLGVIQVCRKGDDLASSGPEFTADDLHHLERSAAQAAKAAFMKKSALD
jgi:GAF domain-containing protein